MGLFTQSSLMHWRARAGVALPVALFGVVTVSLLGGGMLMLSTSNMPIARNREEQARAMMLAEAAASHALAVLRGPLRNTAYNTLLLDSLVVGHGLPTGSQIPATGVSFGGGTYYAKIVDDPGATEDGNRFNDVNRRLVLRCTGVTGTGATAVINAIFGTAPMPAFVANGNVAVNGSSASVLGPCGSVHANGDLGAPVNSGITVEATYSAAGNAYGAPVTPDGTAAVAESNANSIPVPSYTYNDFCPGSADYILRSDGWLVHAMTGIALNANGNNVSGWGASIKKGVTTWEGNGAMLPATYCVEGNVTVSGNPVVSSLSIIAQGSLSVTGTPVITAPDHPDQLLFFAGGDLVIAGNAEALYPGVMYTRNQCDIGGNGRIVGGVMCLDQTTVAPATNLLSGNAIRGNVTLTNDCSLTFGTVRRILGWYQTLN
jgi:hypothetical protein